MPPSPNDMLSVPGRPPVTRSALAAEFGLPATTSNAELEARLTTSAAAARERHIAVPITDAEGASLANTPKEPSAMPIPFADVTKELKAAVDRGAIADHRRAHWRRVLERDGETGRAQLRALAAGEAGIEASAGTPSRQPAGTRHVSMPAPSTGLVRNAMGELSYKGLPAFMGDDGHPRVVTSSGPMRPETVDASIKPEELQAARVSVELTASLGMGAQIGMPHRSPLLGGMADVAPGGKAAGTPVATTGWFPGLDGGEAA